MITEEAVEGIKVTLARLEPQEGDILLVKAENLSADLEIAIAESLYVALEMAGIKKVPVVVATYDIELGILTREGALRVAEQLLSGLEGE